GGGCVGVGSTGVFVRVARAVAVRVDVMAVVLVAVGDPGVAVGPNCSAWPLVMTASTNCGWLRRVDTPAVAPTDDGVRLDRPAQSKLRPKTEYGPSAFNVLAARSTA